jgi:hypothetical protein
METLKVTRYQVLYHAHHAYMKRKANQSKPATEDVFNFHFHSMKTFIIITMFHHELLKVKSRPRYFESDPSDDPMLDLLTPENIASQNK